MSWNLPDGCSDADIDAAFGDSDDTADRIVERLTDAGWPDDDAQEYVDSLTEGELLDWADDPWTLPSHASWLADKWWSGWNPHWVAYAAELGVDPDDESLTGHGFTAWLQDRATGRAVSPSDPGRTCPAGLETGGAPIDNNNQGA